MTSTGVRRQPAPSGPPAVRAVRFVARAGGGWFVATIAMMSFGGVGTAAVVYLAQFATGRMDADSVTTVDSQVWLLGSVVVILVALVAMAQLAATGVHRLLAERVMKAWSERVLHATAFSDVREFETPAFHDQLRRAQRGSLASVHISMAVPQILGSAVASVGLVAALALTTPMIVPVVIISGLPLLLAGRANGDEMYSFDFGHTPNDRERAALERVLSSRDQSAEVRVFGLQRYLLQRWDDLYSERLLGLDQLVSKFIVRSVAAALGVAMTLVLTLGVLGWLLSTGRIDLLSAAAAGVTTLLLGSQVQRLAGNLGKLREQAHQISDMEAATAAVSQPAPLKPRAARLESLELEDVDFRYPSTGSDALTNVDLALEAGEMIAIVGANGSGKTTLAKLLCGLTEPTGGTMCWNGEPFAAVDVQPEVGAIFQTFARYWFTAAENIAVGSMAVGEEPDHEAVRRAAGRAGAHEFISALPDGYDTRLTVELERGADLSLGQWQRIAIARVLYREPSLVVLDEPTASLDPQAEAALFTTLDRLREGRTIVVISHRFSTVRNADRIVVMDQGRIVEQGSHDELVLGGGRYAEMYAVQAAAYQLN